MIGLARGRFIQTSPRKIRQVVRLLRGMEVIRAQVLLANLPKGACRPISKVLNSAVANATRDGSWSAEQLVISRILADGGPVMKRFRAAAMGRALSIKKRLCHLTIELDTKR